MFYDHPQFVFVLLFRLRASSQLLLCIALWENNIHQQQSTHTHSNLFQYTYILHTAKCTELCKYCISTTLLPWQAVCSNTLYFKFCLTATKALSCDSGWAIVCCAEVLCRWQHRLWLITTSHHFILFVAAQLDACECASACQCVVCL